MTTSRISQPRSQTAATFVAPPYEQPHVFRQAEELLKQVADVIAPVWPLKDYVAVNPYSGISERTFTDARAFLRVFSDCETLMPTSYYAQEFQQRGFDTADIAAAIAELGPAAAGGVTAEQIAKLLRSNAESPSTADPSPPNRDRRIHTMTHYVSQHEEIDWSEAVCEELSKHCAAHYDQGQALWSSPWKHLQLYQAWRSAALHDCNLEVLGLRGLREYVSRLPHTPEAAIVYSLQVLKVPQKLWVTFLLCQAFSVPGWSAWARYQDESSSGAAGGHFASLLAIRLAYDAALGQAFSLSVNWNAFVGNDRASFRSSLGSPDDDAQVRMVLLRASEIALRNRLLQSLAAAPVAQRESQVAEPATKLAQVIFCIDVRSERIRRQLESVCEDIETLGFAGFFGMPLEYVLLGEQVGTPQVPVLLKPQFQLHEGALSSDTCEVNAIHRRRAAESWQEFWRGFQCCPIGCFSFVETSGLLYGLKLLGRAIGFSGWTAAQRGGRKSDQHKLGPTLRGLNQQGVTTSRQADLAESMLRNLGLTSGFARLVVFCGHASETENNPLAAALDCGACGGHSGEPNARLAALLLNQPYIRASLAARGIEIPSHTHFLAALHNTTTDQLQYFDLDSLPETHQADAQTLLKYSCDASKQTRTERMPVVASKSIAELVARAGDWSEVRPEWGLAGNATFIVAPRTLTKTLDLQARSFLHSYDHRQDPDGTVLETIMTAPMIVAHWINMQYYASTVDYHHFGSGNKTLHNVVGRFGILSGNGGDLRTGLPWQSLHSGTGYQHQPLRLQVVIDAPRKAIERVIEKHEVVANLLAGGWLHLVALSGAAAYRYDQDGNWKAV